MLITEIENLTSKCTGCGACACACSQKAIAMVKNAEGFLYPEIKSDKCTHCGNCSEVCHLQQQSKNNVFEQSVYACQIKDSQMLIHATAGGFFPLLAKTIIEQGGIVYGCSWDSDMNAVHNGGTTVDAIKEFSGSKYLQSNTTKVFPEICEHLKNGKKVLFSGTPCQVDSVLRYCRNLDCSNLITVDVPCYGVPSQSVFSAYIEKLNKKNNAKVIDFRFRDKRHYGWSHTTFITFKRDDGTCFEIEEADHNKIDYYKMFGNRNCYRKSCYQCLYNTLERVSDFTTGNYWGIERKSHVFDATRGVSMVIINSEKALKIFESIKVDMITEERTAKDAVDSNEALTKVTAYPNHRDDIYKSFAKHGFDGMFKRYYKPNPITRIKTMARKFLKKMRGGKV